MNIPLLFSALVLIFFDTPLSAFIFLGLIGISNGLPMFWAHLHGLKFMELNILGLLKL